MGHEQLRLEDVAGTFQVRVPLDTRHEIARLKAQGYSHGQIATSLNTRGIPTSSGRGQWHSQTVGRAVDPITWRNYIRSYRARQRLLG